MDHPAIIRAYYRGVSHGRQERLDEAILRHSLRPWVHPDNLNIAVKAVLADQEKKKT